MLYPSSPHCCDFYPRSPCGERRAANSSSGKSITISIHALLAESDLQAVKMTMTAITFLSTLSLRRATLHFLAVVRAFRISIHALLAESDAVTTVVVDPSRDFYPRSPCGERLKTPPQGSRSRIFLSTLSLRRATHCNKIFKRRILYFYPRSPCGERLFGKIKYCCSTRDFYPRSPCGERLTGAMQYLRSFVFLSTLSLRRATAPSCPAVGERLFLSTLSLRRATSPAMQILTSRLEFLSTLSLRRATHPLAILSNSHTDFYPRSPCGERRVEWRNKPQVSAISIHALLAESDILSSQCHPNI